ncbi:GNAT family N-acetyltransferase [Nocardioides terrisoli]|uniref:GNAT family N-acetyltransferase n=1 Tax=Nocardioides terrisoli TaxID=3388267 RepID=UPI00287B84EE|nr:GNAT family N-acetyltransferase [Nocardioides marmorisolisilvae]
MTPDDGPAKTGQHGLGPHVVGQRVVVRRLLPGQLGPTGGPAFTDVLGICESWADGVVVVRREDGTTVPIRIAEIVSGKPVPPRPSRFARWSADEVEARAAHIVRPIETVHLGDWLLRSTGGSTRRANSLLPVGTPDRPLPEALAAVARFYGERDRPAWAQVVAGSEVEASLLEHGWRPDPGSDTHVMLAGTAGLSRRLRGHDRAGVRHQGAVDRDWLVGRPEALSDYDRVAAMLELPDATFASIEHDGRQLARGRVNLVEDWALLADLVVQPDHRLEGLAHRITAALTDWAGERGATAMLLQVHSANEPAQRLYDGLGFELHHTYRYLAPAPLAQM